jgi:WD40 repeat protein
MSTDSCADALSADGAEIRYAAFSRDLGVITTVAFFSPDSEGFGNSAGRSVPLGSSAGGNLGNASSRDIRVLVGHQTGFLSVWDWGTSECVGIGSGFPAESPGARGLSTADAASWASSVRNLLRKTRNALGGDDSLGPNDSGNDDDNDGDDAEDEGDDADAEKARRGDARRQKIDQLEADEAFQEYRERVGARDLPVLVNDGDFHATDGCREDLERQLTDPAALWGHASGPVPRFFVTECCPLDGDAFHAISLGRASGEQAQDVVAVWKWDEEAGCIAQPRGEASALVKGFTLTKETVAHDKSLHAVCVTSEHVILGGANSNTYVHTWEGAVVHVLRNGSSGAWVRDLRVVCPTPSMREQSGFLAKARGPAVVITSCDDGSIGFFDLGDASSGGFLHRVTPHGDYIRNFAISEEGGLACVCDDHGVTLLNWDGSTKKSLPAMHANWATAVDACGSAVLTGGRDGVIFAIRGWGEEDEEGKAEDEVLQRFEGGEGDPEKHDPRVYCQAKATVTAVAWHPNLDGGFAAGGRDGVLRFWAPAARFTKSARKHG